MTEDHLSERMPDVARGAAEWTAAESAHLEACTTCAAEWRVIRRFATGGPTVRVAADQVAARVLARLGEDTPVIALGSRRPWRRMVIGLAAAASVALAVAVWQPWSGGGAEVAMTPTSEPTMLPELDALFAAELEVVLATITPTEPEPLGEVPRLGDLTDDELELLLLQVEES